MLESHRNDASIIAIHIVAGLLIAGAAFFFKWTGTGFTLGFLFGVVAFSLYWRRKYGYWPD